MAPFDFGVMMSQENQVTQMPLDMLVPYHNHNFTLYEGERLSDMVESIKANGVMTPIIVQPLGDKYEILIGHNRWHASKLAGKEFIPAIVKENLSEEEAEIYVIESNLIQRGFSELKVSEQAKVLALRHESLFSQGKRTDIINELLRLEGKNNTVRTKHNSEAMVGEEYNLSHNTVARLLRINKLHDGMQKWIDNGDLSIRAAVELSYIDPEKQELLYQVNTDPTTNKMIKRISEKTAKLLRRTANTADRQAILAILLGDTPKNRTTMVKNIKLEQRVYEKYFEGMNERAICNFIEKALDFYAEHHKS